MNWLHVYPEDDMMDHNLGLNADCLCNPEVSIGDSLIIHTSLDRMFRGFSAWAKRNLEGSE